jgi:hypothetical protein
MVLVGCGKEIGDACVVGADCSPNGDRICLSQDTGDKGGYCTVSGCAYSTCPEEAACVRFFTGNFTNKPCDPAQPTDCSLDELCGLEGHCVPRSSEIRFCMRKCSSQGDCRDGYECRDVDLMKQHGGEPVLAPGVEIDDKSPKFCAPAPATS